MASALNELNARISELRADLKFIALASQIRPRIGEIVNWEAAGEVLELAKQFMNAKSSRPEGLFGPLLVKLLAAFERYLRLLINETVEHHAAAATTYEKLSGTLSQRNVILTGRMLANVDDPRDYLRLDVDMLIANLASCQRGSSSFRLNSQAFSAIVTGASPAVIEKALKNVDVSNWWDGVGANVPLAKHLETKGARATGDQAQERLKELWRWRNQLAHGGDEEIALTETQLSNAIDFVEHFSVALDSTIEKRLQRAAP